MTFWQYVGAAVVICVFLFMVFAGVFEWIALRDQNEPRTKTLGDYYEEHEDERPKK